MQGISVRDYGDGTNAADSRIVFESKTFQASRRYALVTKFSQVTASGHMKLSSFLLCATAAVCPLFAAKPPAADPAACKHRIGPQHSRVLAGAGK